MKFKSLLTLAALSLVVAIPNQGLGKTVPLETHKPTTAKKYALKGMLAITPEHSFSLGKVITKDEEKQGGNLYIWSTSNGKLLETLEHDGRVVTAAWSSDGKSLIVRSIVGEGAQQVNIITLWDISHL